VYIKHYLLINKQFSIDSFLDWKGLLSGISARIFRLALTRFRSAKLSDARSTECAKGIGDQKVIELVMKLCLRKYNFNLKYSEKMVELLYYVLKIHADIFSMLL